MYLFPPTAPSLPATHPFTSLEGTTTSVNFNKDGGLGALPPLPLNLSSTIHSGNQSSVVNQSASNAATSALRALQDRVKLLEHQNQLLDQRLIEAHSRSQALSTQLSACKCLPLKDELAQVKQLYKASVDEKEILRARVRSLEGELTQVKDEL